MSEKKQKEEADELAQWNMGRLSVGAKDFGKGQAENAPLRSVNLAHPL